MLNESQQKPKKKKFNCVNCHKQSEVPIISVCCFQTYCEGCYSQQQDKVCPRCNKANIQFYPSSFLREQQKSQARLCPNCKEKIQLNKFKNHLANCINKDSQYREDKLSTNIEKTDYESQPIELESKATDQEHKELNQTEDSQHVLSLQEFTEVYIKANKIKLEMGSNFASLLCAFVALTVVDNILRIRELWLLHGMGDSYEDKMNSQYHNHFVQTWIILIYNSVLIIGLPAFFWILPKTYNLVEKWSEAAKSFPYFFLFYCSVLIPRLVYQIICSELFLKKGGFYQFITYSYAVCQQQKENNKPTDKISCKFYLTMTQTYYIEVFFLFILNYFCGQLIFFFHDSIKAQHEILFKTISEQYLEYLAQGNTQA